MKIKNTNDERNNSKFLSLRIKILSFLLFCFLNFYSAQNDGTDQNLIYVTSDAKIVEENYSNHLEKSKIYTTSGASIVDVKGSSFEIKKISNRKKYVASKSKAIIYSKHKTIITEPKKHKVAQTFSKDEDKEVKITSLPESAHSFSVNQNRRTAISQTLIKKVKPYSTADNTDYTIAVLVLDKTKISTYFSYYNNSIYLAAVSIRPPPLTL